MYPMRISRQIGLFLARYRTRRALERQRRRLALMDDHMLADIGLDRADLDELLRTRLWPVPRPRPGVARRPVADARHAL